MRLRTARSAVDAAGRVLADRGRVLELGEARRPPRTDAATPPTPTATTPAATAASAADVQPPAPGRAVRRSRSRSRARRARTSCTCPPRTRARRACRSCSTSTASARTRCSRWSTATSSPQADQNDFLDRRARRPGQRRRPPLQLQRRAGPPERHHDGAVAAEPHRSDAVRRRDARLLDRHVRRRRDDLGARVHVARQVRRVRPGRGDHLLRQQRRRGRSPIESFSGTADPVVPFNGGAVHCCGGPVLPSKPSAMAKWAAHDHCNAKFTDTRLGREVVRRTWSGCKPGSTRRLLHHRRRRPHVAGRDPDRSALGLTTQADQGQRRDLEVLRRAQARELIVYRRHDGVDRHLELRGVAVGVAARAGADGEVDRRRPRSRGVRIVGELPSTRRAQACPA